LDWLLATLPQIGVDLFNFMLLQVIPDFVVAVAGFDHGDIVNYPAAFDLAVRRLDEAVVVDTRVATQRRDQSDVGTFRGLNRADTSVVRGMHVANFESRTFARQTARPKRRETPLVRDLGERVGLVHE